MCSLVNSNHLCTFQVQLMRLTLLIVVYDFFRTCALDGCVWFQRRRVCRNANYVAYCPPCSIALHCILYFPAALESMRNAHEAELLAERNKFIDLIAKTYSQADVEVLQHQHEYVL